MVIKIIRFSWENFQLTSGKFVMFWARHWDVNTKVILGFQFHNAKDFVIIVHEDVLAFAVSFFVYVANNTKDSKTFLTKGLITSVCL